jgi:hypothetical protein
VDLDALADRLLHVVRVRLLVVVNVDREHPRADADHGGRGLEEGGRQVGLGLQSRRHYDQSQRVALALDSEVCADGQDPAQQSDQQIPVDLPLMRLVYYNHRILV